MKNYQPNYSIDFDKIHEITEAESWHFSDVILYATKLAGRGEKDHAMRIANLLRKESNLYEPDTYFNTVAAIAERLAKVGKLSEAESLISMSQIPLVDDNSLEDSTRVLFVIANEYAKQNNHGEFERILSVAEDLLNRRSSTDEAQANLALSLGFLWTKIGELSKALDSWKMAISIANKRILDSTEIKEFGFEERRIIASAITGVAQALSIQTAETLLESVQDERAKRKSELILEKARSSLKT